MPTISEHALSHLHAWIERRMAADGTPGISLAITDRERVIDTAAFGLANIDAGTPVTPHHLFETGSIGKSFTAIALLQLADEGKIDLQAPVTDYLPWFSIRSEFEPIRLHHLLTHTAGITSALDFAPAGRIQVWALRDAVATTPPGTHFHYSNIGYKVLGEVLEAVSGETYGPVIQRRILDPLNLRDSVPVITHDVRPRLAVGYGPAYDDRPWWPGRPLAPATWLETDTADGCLAMTAVDLAGYLRMLLNRGEGPNGRVLSAAGFELLTQQAARVGGDESDFWYGYGIVTGSENGRRYIEHGGGMVGYFASMVGDPDLGLGVVALINGPGSPSAYTQTTLDLLQEGAEGGGFEYPKIADPMPTGNEGDFEGTYRLHDQGVPDTHPSEVVVTVEEDRLSLGFAGKLVGLRPNGDDLFVSDDPVFDRFMLAFDRDGERVTGFIHGEANYPRVGEPAPVFEAPPSDWLPFPGHYRSHNPWTTDFRVVLNRGRLWLILPAEPDGLEVLQPLVPLDDGSFRCGEDERIPECIRFDVVIDGKAQRANLSLCEFYRVNTP